VGRKAYDESAMITSRLAKQLFRIPTVTSLRSRLLGDPSLRQISGFSRVPSGATFSRRYSLYARHKLMEQPLGLLVSNYLEGRIVGHVSRDSTAIEMREKATATKASSWIPCRHRIELAGHRSIPSGSGYLPEDSCFF